MHGGLQDAELGFGFGEEAVKVLDDVVSGIEFQVAAGCHQVMRAHLDSAALDGVGLGGGGAALRLCLTRFAVRTDSALGEAQDTLYSRGVRTER